MLPPFCILLEISPESSDIETSYITWHERVHCSTFVFPFCLHIQTRAQIQINPQQ